jgi:rsbT antagonist protein RsbS
MVEAGERGTDSVRIPILKIEDVLVASIQIALDDSAVVRFQGDLLREVARTGAGGVVADITAVDVVDSFMARSLNDIAVSVHLLGAQMVIVGMQPALAVTLVEMGLTIPNALTALDLERGLRLLRSRATPTAKQTEGEGEDDGRSGA